MTEPSSTAAGIIVGAGIGLTGTVIGAQVDALLIGLAAAILISFWLPTINSRRRAAASVALSALFAGYGAPVAVGWLITSTEAASKIDMADGDPLRLFVALALGTVCPTIVPLLIGWARRKVEAQQ